MIAVLFVLIHLILNQNYVLAPYIQATNPISIFELLSIGKWSQTTNWILYYLLIFSLFLSFLGLKTRLFLSFSTVLYFFFMGNYLGIAKSPHSTSVWHNHNMVFMLLLVMATLPSVGNIKFTLKGLSFKPTIRSKKWEEVLILLTICSAYFGAGYCKLAVSGLTWMNGYTLQAFMLKKYMITGNPYAKYFIVNFNLSLVLSWLTILLECLFVFGLLLPFLRWIIWISLFVFHYCIFLTMDVNFLTPHFLICSAYFFTLVFEKIRTFIRGNILA